MKNRILASIAIISLAFVGINFVLPQTGKQCITVYVDFGSLDNDKKSQQCIEVDTRIDALSLMKKSGISLSGTDKYGNKVVCRVNGLPLPNREKCQSMPPENAYWAVIVKKKSSLVNIFPAWGWAQTGINDVYLSVGDSLGLVFVEDGKIKWPN